MKIYKKAIKRHEEVWADVPDYGDGRVMVCTGNSNYGRFYVTEPPQKDDVPWAVWLSDEETAAATLMFKEIWEKNKDNNPFGDQ